MKTEFANLLLQEKFNDAASMLIDKVLNVRVPIDVNLTINIDKEANILDLSEALKKISLAYKQIHSQLNFNDIWKDVFKREELKEKHHLSINDEIITKAKNVYLECIEDNLRKYYEEIFDSYLVGVGATIQEVVDAAVLI